MAETASDYIALRSVQAQIAATQDIITAQSQSLNLLNQQFELGAVAKGCACSGPAKCSASGW